MAYRETIEYLESLINYEKIASWSYKESLKLERMRGFLESIGSPQAGLKCVHIAGSKGKGSTCAFIAYVLREAGFKAGLYTSPHLSDFRERIRILSPRPYSLGPIADFEGMIACCDLARFVKRLKPAIEKFNHKSKFGPLSFFEVYTALAFAYFKEKKVDFAVLETGLGGRLDATNAVNAQVCVITPISLEHTQKLGNTLARIAGEKAGIIKIKKSIVVTAPQEKEAMAVIRARCKETGARLYEPGKDISLKPQISSLKLKLLGKHQKVNAACAVAAIKALGLKISAAAIKTGLCHTRWPGRCEVIRRQPLVIVDGAQNAASARVFKNAIKENFPAKRIILVFGICRDKDIKGTCEELSNFADEIILTRARNPRAADPEDLKAHFGNRDVYLTQDVRQAKEKSLALAKKNDLVLVCGSLFIVGEFRDTLSTKAKDVPGGDNPRFSKKGVPMLL